MAGSTRRVWWWVFLLSLLLTACGSPTNLRSSRTPTIAQHAKPPAVAGAWLQVAPANATPGETVTIRGYIPGAGNRGGGSIGIALGAMTHGNVCFGGCRYGLLEQAVNVRMSRRSLDHFTMKMLVPKTAWLAANGPHPLENGTYRVGVQCIGPGIRRCAEAPSEASTVLRLTGVRYRPCAPGRCGRIGVSSETVTAGEVVRFHGWAPLNQIVGQPFPYTVVLLPGNLPSGLHIARRNSYALVGQVQQNLNGTFQGTLRIPSAPQGAHPLLPGRYTLALQGDFLGPSYTVVTFAPTPVYLRSAESWAALGSLHPLQAIWSADLFGASPVADPTNPSRLAYCQRGVIRLSTDGGQNWTTVPVSGAVTLAAATQYQLTPSLTSPTQVSCAAVMLDPSHSDTLYASFWASNPKFGLPPAYQVGYVTTDLGQTWNAVPVPTGYGVGGFAGFQTAGNTVLALFERQAPNFGPWQYAVAGTIDGGSTWHATSLACPAIGPCLRFGPSPSQIGGMGVPFPQPLEWSGNGGKTWQTPSWPAQVYLNQGPSEIVALSRSWALLVSGPSQYAVRLTTNGGRTWHDIALPSPPDLQNGAVGLMDAMILPSGALLAQDPNNLSWILLAPGANQWCVISALRGAVVAQPQVTGHQLWYEPMVPGTVQVPVGIPLQNIGCGR